MFLSEFSKKFRIAGYITIIVVGLGVTEFLFPIEKSIPSMLTTDSFSTETLENMVALHEKVFGNFSETIYQKDPIERENLQNKYDSSIRDIAAEYQNMSAKMPAYDGKIVYREKPEIMRNLGFFQTQLHNSIPEISELIENTGSYTHVGDIHFADKKVAKLFFVQADAFYGDSSVFYFIEYQGEYFFIPSMSFDTKNSSNIEKILILRKGLVQRNIHLFEEVRFLHIFDGDFSIPQNIAFQKNAKNYVLSLIRRVPTLLSSELSSRNLRKIEDLSSQIGKNVYVEKSGENIWFDERFRSLEILRTSLSGSEEFDKLDEVTKNIYLRQLEQQRLFQSDAIFIEIPDHTVALYQIQIPFEQTKKGTDGSYEESQIYLLKDNKREILKGYNYRDGGSCGIKDGTFLSVPDGTFQFEVMRILSVKKRENAKMWDTKTPQDISMNQTQFHYTEDDLVPIGSTGDGEPLLYFRDVNHPFLHAMYDYGYKGELDMQGCLGDAKEYSCPKNILSFKEYTQTLPIFFWRDPFGRVVLFISITTMAPSTCAAKPVIYLYPKKETQVSVSLDWEKKSLISIPEYRNGWNIVAHSSGILQAGGISYPYLFWEDEIRYPKPHSGFVVARADMSSFLSHKLAFLGLNTREISDFQEYWMPHMQASPYYRVSFLTRETMDQSAPITVTPKPDSIQRIFMDFEELQKPIPFPQQDLVPFVRLGFSVIEWGGKRGN